MSSIRSSVKLSLLTTFFEPNASQPFCLGQWASGEELISWAMGGANVCTHVEYIWVWFWSYYVCISSCRRSLESKQSWKKSLLCCFPCLALHWTCYHGVSDSVHSFKRLASQVGYCYSMAWVAMDFWYGLSIIDLLTSDMQGLVWGEPEITRVHILHLEDATR